MAEKTESTMRAYIGSKQSYDEVFGYGPITEIWIELPATEAELAGQLGAYGERRWINAPIDVERLDGARFGLPAFLESGGKLTLDEANAIAKLASAARPESLSALECALDDRVVKYETPLELANLVAQANDLAVEELPDFDFDASLEERYAMMHLEDDDFPKSLAELEARGLAEYFDTDAYLAQGGDPTPDAPLPADDFDANFDYEAYGLELSQEYAVLAGGRCYYRDCLPDEGPMRPLELYRASIEWDARREAAAPLAGAVKGAAPREKAVEEAVPSADRSRAFSGDTVPAAERNRSAKR